MTVTHRPPAALSPRASVASGALRLSNRLSRALGRGSGTVAGGRVGLALDPGLLATLASGKRVALVTGTNGKTTTTRLLVAAVSSPVGPPPASNDTGANMPAGHLSALVEAPASTSAILEVDEGYLERLVTETQPRVVVLLNLSRDQLDRISEVRMLADRWRSTFSLLAASGGMVGDGSGPDTVVVANTDDPMVAYAAEAAPTVRWVGAGQVWRNDAVGCPKCGGRITYGTEGTWSCDRCAFARPDPEVWLDGDDLMTSAGERLPIDLMLPGRFNRANAAMAAIAAVELIGGDLGPVLARISSVSQVAGRFSVAQRMGRQVRLLLAKNPAGWTAISDLLEEDGASPSPVVLSVNARVADGFDTSWLWDVPFERLAGRLVVATGERRLDLAVRLRYAGVAHVVVADPLAALDRAIQLAGAPDGNGSSPGCHRIDFIANYTAFAELRRKL